jgi:DNA-directed RNA polymerase I subunit RPA2
MEDAMIINKASYERGFAHGCVYKSEFFELKSVSYNVNRSCQVVSISDK